MGRSGRWDSHTLCFCRCARCTQGARRCRARSRPGACPVPVWRLIPRVRNGSSPSCSVPGHCPFRGALCSRHMFPGRCCLARFCIPAMACTNRFAMGHTCGLPVGRTHGLAMASTGSLAMVSIRRFPMARSGCLFRPRPLLRHARPDWCSRFGSRPARCLQRSCWPAASFVCRMGQW